MRENERCGRRRERARESWLRGDASRKRNRGVVVISPHTYFENGCFVIPVVIESEGSRKVPESLVSGG